MADHGHRAGTRTLALGALGVVFGDIGTSPLYAFREAFEHQDLTVDTTNAFGVASIAFWASSALLMVTNPNPRGRPLKRSIIMLATTTVPCAANATDNSFTVLLNETFPTNSNVLI